MVDSKVRKSLEERKNLVFEAGSKKLQSGKFHWNAGVTLEWLSLETGIDIAQISKDFDGKNKLSKALAKYCLQSPEELATFQQHDSVFSESASIQEITIQIAKIAFDIRRGNLDIHSRMLLFGVSDHDPGIRKTIGELYDNWVDTIETSLRRWLEQKHRNGDTVEMTLNVREFLMALTALIEGSVIISRTEPETNPENFFETAVLGLVNGLIGPGDIHLD